MTDESNKDFIDIFGEYVEEPSEIKSDGYKKHKRLTKPSFKDQMYLARQRARAKLEAEQAAKPAPDLIKELDLNRTPLTLEELTKIKKDRYDNFYKRNKKDS
jgi:hypothetical protein|tara:strand:+ start:457 stop:762 length:306 start_codon:yes stop_codon:yes gene_type:complete